MTLRYRAWLVAAVLAIAAACTATATHPPSPPPVGGTPAGTAHAPTAFQSPLPGSLPPSEAVITSPNPFLVPGYLGGLAASAGLPASIGGHALRFSTPTSIPDYWVTSGIAAMVGLTKGDVYLFVSASDGPDAQNQLGTMGVTAVGFRGAQAPALLDAFVRAAKTWPGSLCPTFTFSRTTLAGKRIVIEAGMPPRRQPNGKLAFPGARQYAYAHGDILSLFVAANQSAAADLVAGLP